MLVLFLVTQKTVEVEWFKDVGNEVDKQGCLRGDEESGSIDTDGFELTNTVF